MEINGQLHALATLSLGKEPAIPFGYEAGLNPCSSLDVVVKRKYPCPPVIQPIA
jgi:hypothetical protein